jgi:hypothetical protein
MGATTLRRRVRAVVAMSLLGLAALTISACGDSGTDEPEGVAPVSGTFVGRIDGIDSFIAVVAERPEDGGGTRAIRAYLCNGAAINEWFTGGAEGNDIALSSESEASLEGELTPTTASGLITSASGKSVRFEAALATEIAGIYSVTLSPDREVRGSSTTGGTLAGRLGARRRDGRYPITGTIADSSDQTRPFTTLASASEAGRLLWIVLPDGQFKGGFGGGGFQFGSFQGGGFQGGGFQFGGIQFGGGGFQGGFNFGGGGFQKGIGFGGFGIGDGIGG